MGFDRRSAIGPAERTNFPSEVAEAALAHVVGDKVEAAYRRGDLFEKRRRLMEAWAEYCAKRRGGRECCAADRGMRHEVATDMVGRVDAVSGYTRGADVSLTRAACNVAVSRKRSWVEAIRRSTLVA